jgi:hypothetical protein
MKGNEHSSIRGSDTLAIKLVEIRQSIKHPQNKGKVSILLEGNTDIQLFRKIFSSKYTDMTGVDGKDIVEQALILLAKEGLVQVIGIRDADFSHLEQDYKDIYNLFLTDYHDSEVMMINSPALDNVIQEFSSEICYKSLRENLKKNILEYAVYIGYLRWFHEKEIQSTGKYPLKFKKLNFNKFVTIGQCELFLDENNFIETLLEHSQPKALTANDLFNNIEKLKQKSKDYLQICSGHDLTKLISLIFSKKDNCMTGNINQEKIESSLRLSFKIEYFKETHLYQNIMEWANKHNYKIFNE